MKRRPRGSTGDDGRGPVSADHWRADRRLPFGWNHGHEAATHDPGRDRLRKPIRAGRLARLSEAHWRNPGRLGLAAIRIVCDGLGADELAFVDDETPEAVANENLGSDAVTRVRKA